MELSVTELAPTQKGQGTYFILKAIIPLHKKESGHTTLFTVSVNIRLSQNLKLMLLVLEKFLKELLLVIKYIMLTK